MAQFALATDLRQANVKGLEWGQVDMQRHTAWVHPDQAKGGRGICVPLNKVACQVVQRQLGKHPRFVFTYNGKPVIRGEEPLALHVLSNLSRLQGHRKRVIELMEHDGIARAPTEIRTCGWLAQVDEHGGSIFHYRPHAKGAKDILVLKEQVLISLGLKSSPDSLTIGRSQLVA